MYLIIVPAWDVDYFDQNFPVSKVSGIETGNLTFSINHFYFAGVIREINKPPSEIFQEGEIIELINLTENLSATVVARTLTGEDSLDVSSVITGDSPLVDESNEWLLDEILDTLETIARFARCGVELVIDGWKIVPPTGTERAVKVVLGSPPPGFYQRHVTGTLFGSQICNKDYRVTLVGPAVDMGIVVKNDIGEEIAQIIDHTIYLFLPQNESSHAALSKDGDDIFGRALGLAWNVYQTEDTRPEQVMITSANELAALTPSPARKKEMITAAIELADEDIAATQRKLRKAMSHKRTLVVLLVGSDCQLEIDYDEAWERLNADPIFDSVVKSSDDKTHYFTKPITIIDKAGEEHYLGRYGIRFQSTEKVAVWSLDHPHYSGVPHPHINKHGDVCLGNVSESVWQLLIDDREADAALLVMQLLADGYDETLAEHKLEEWPTVTQHERRKKRESLTPKVHAGP